LAPIGTTAAGFIIPSIWLHDLGRLRIDIGDHLMNDGADDPLLQARIGRRGGPDGLEVYRERGERAWVISRQTSSPHSA